MTRISLRCTLVTPLNSRILLIISRSGKPTKVTRKCIWRKARWGMPKIANTHYIIEGVPTELEARNLAAYMRTKFFRFMVNLLRSNQNMRPDMYQFAPRLDFTRSWTDSQLYERYDLVQEERDFIDQVIRDLDLK